MNIWKFIKKSRTIFVLTLSLVFMSLTASHGEGAATYYSFKTLDLKKWYVSHGWSNGDHQACEWRKDAAFVRDNKLQLRLSDKGGAKRPIGCGEVQTLARTGYGRYEARMRSAAGSGLNSAFFTYIGPPVGVAEHDEIDFEFLGKDPFVVEVTHHTNGKRHAPVKVQLGFDSSKEFHNYAFDWRKDSIRWYVDDKLVHETKPGDAIPRNPGHSFFSLWSGSKIEDDWMGPFKYTAPVTAEVVWMKYTPW